MTSSPFPYADPAAEGAGRIEDTDPAGHGAGRVGSFVVPFDAACLLCRTARSWRAARAQLLPLYFVAAGSAEARSLAASSRPPRRYASPLARRTTVTFVTSAADEPDDRDTSSGSGAGDKPRRARGEQTRQLILETALRLFRERGYAETTMRAIAKEAGVAVGNAYYYFDSKEHLIQGFYDRNQAALKVRADEVMASESDFAARLRGVYHAGIDVNAPYHAFAATFFKTAAEPTSPLSPFSSESSPTREASIEMFRELVDGSSAKLDPELRKELPELLWLAYMGVVLFWVHDRSPGQRRTRRLIDGVVPLIDRLVSLSRLRVLRPALRQVLALIETVQKDD
jgi:AcrR family transcriptional regulator